MNDQTNSHLPSSEVRRYAVNGAPQICRARPESDFRTPQAGDSELCVHWLRDPESRTRAGVARPRDRRSGGAYLADRLRDLRLAPCQFVVPDLSSVVDDSELQS